MLLNFQTLTQLIQQTKMWTVVSWLRVLGRTSASLYNLRFTHTCTILVIICHTKSSGTHSAFNSFCEIVQINLLAIRWPGCKKEIRHGKCVYQQNICLIEILFNCIKIYYVQKSYNIMQFSTTRT